MVVVDQTSTGHIVKPVLELIRELISIAEGLLEQLLVHPFVGAFSQHVGADVKPNNIFESLVMEVLSNKARTTTKINDVQVLRLLLEALGEAGHIVGNVLRVWISHSEIHSFIV